ncbi:restriction endonuclease subunit S [Pseudomonas sp. NPDC077649]|uniref:restriction endonuclease subunit S n=1 Tax=Pseudomonas sp. NPDC077649 TaxID=3364423 RepID=UPI0037C4FF5D
MSWPEVVFESIFAEPSRNGVYKSKEHHGSGVPIVNMGELFAFDRIGEQPASLLQMSDAELVKSGLIDGDLLFGRRSLIEAGAGKCSMVYRPSRPMTFESSIIRVRLDQSVADPEFFFNYFRSPIGRSRVRAIVGGATVKGIRGSDLKLIKVHLPPINEQVAIRQLVSAYDDLIATNQRRITLLEDAARRLYREWFVQLRFPGHESVLLRDGVPEGWRRDTLDQALFLQRGFDLPNGNRVPGDVPVYASTGVNGYHNEAKVDGPGVVTGRSGTLGAVHYVAQDFWPLNTSLWVKEFRAVSPLVAYFLMAELGLEQFNSGASVPTLDRKVAHQIPVLIPERNVVSAFDERVQPLFDQVHILRKSNESTARARDLLLPKLMSGQLDVSGIPLPDEVAA